MSRGAQGTFGAAKVLCVRGLRWPHALRRWSEPLGQSAPRRGPAGNCGVLLRGVSAWFANFDGWTDGRHQSITLTIEEAVSGVHGNPLNFLLNFPVT